MKKAIATLKSVSPYSQGRYHKTEKKEKELHADYEKRTWRDKLHYNEKGIVIIPPMQFANCLKEAAKYLSIQIPGKGKATYTKHFEAGVIVVEPVEIGIHKDDVPHEIVLVPSDGKRGGSNRVEKYFPVIAEWQATVTYFILDDIITKDIFMTILEASGSLIGIGRFRPRNWGYYGRFKVEKLDFIEE